MHMSHDEYLKNYFMCAKYLRVRPNPAFYRLLKTYKTCPYPRLRERALEVCAAFEAHYGDRFDGSRQTKHAGPHNRPEGNHPGEGQ